LGSLKRVSGIKSFDDFWQEFAQKYGSWLGYGSKFGQFLLFFAHNLQNIWTSGGRSVT
jgi:hypothetical protein